MKLTWEAATYLCFAGAVVVASLMPAWAEPADDAYPFSTYPMFASKRVAPRFVIALGYKRGGEIVRVLPEFLGTDEVMQAAATLRKASEDPRRAQQLCRQIVSRFPKEEKLKKVEIVQVKYDPVIYFTEGPTPLSRKVIASCAGSKAHRVKKSKKRGAS